MTDPAQTDRAAGAAAGDVDEFAHIPRARGRHPIVAVAGALLAFFLVFHERRDIRYALASETPLDLGSASALNERALAGLENRYVRLSGTPDRESALQIDTKGSWVFTQLFRLLGTGDRLFIHRPPSPLPAALAESDVFQGRLIRVDDLTFAAAIRRYFATSVSATHFFAPDTFARSLGKGGSAGTVTVPDLSGDPITLAPASVVAVEVAEPDQVRIGLPRARFATEAEARAAITSRAGEIVSALGEIKGRPALNAPEAGALSATPEPPVRWTYVVRFPAAARQAGLDALGNLDHDVEIRDARQSVQLRVDEITPSGTAGGLTLRPGQGPAREIPPAAVAAIHTVEPVVIPSDAYLLVEGDHPRQHLPTVLIAAILVMFAVVNLIGLGRQLRQ
ncbi:MAG TPA: hypothetical protein VMT03_05165 [Polyangia bacterium]|nr:hypothetical protein [Polyangia bacterium]